MVCYSVDQEGKNQNKLREQDITKIVDTFVNHTFESKSDIKRYSKVVTYAEIAENDFNLNIRRYADTSPPAEIFDVRAILHGSVPVREVEDDYIQEAILDSFDVSIVFDRKDDSYFTFKPSITSKEQIRDVVTDADAGISSLVITQLERWWDKYQVSLHALDAQVTDAEQVMQGYLKELGYE